MKKIITLLLTFFLISLIPLGVMAQTEEEPSPSPDDERIKQKVEERIEKVLSDAEERRKQALVGELKEIANSTLTIETDLGDIQTKVMTDAAILNLEREEIELGDLEIGSKIISMGYLDDQDILEAKRVVVVEKFQIPTSEAFFGIVTDISQEETIFTIKNPKDQTIYTVEMGTNVKITKSVEDEIETVKFEDIQEDGHIVVVGEPEENEEKMITAKLIHIIPVETEIPEVGEKTQPSPSPSPISEEEE